MRIIELWCDTENKFKNSLGCVTMLQLWRTYWKVCAGVREEFHLIKCYAISTLYKCGSHYWKCNFPSINPSPHFKSLIKKSLFILILYGLSLADEVTWPNIIWESVQYIIKTETTLGKVRQIQSSLNRGDTYSYKKKTTITTTRRTTTKNYQSRIFFLMSLYNT